MIALKTYYENSEPQKQQASCESEKKKIDYWPLTDF